MIAGLFPCCISLLIAQLTFRGMPLAQGMTLARVIRLHGLENTEVRALLKAVVELPTTPLSGKNITWSGHTFSSLGEAACHCIVVGLSQKHDICKIALLIRVIGWTAPDKLAYCPITISGRNPTNECHHALILSSKRLAPMQINKF